MGVASKTKIKLLSRSNLLLPVTYTYIHKVSILYFNLFVWSKGTKRYLGKLEEKHDSYNEQVCGGTIVTTCSCKHLGGFPDSVWLSALLADWLMPGRCVRYVYVIRMLPSATGCMNLIIRSADQLASAVCGCGLKYFALNCLFSHDLVARTR